MFAAATVPAPARNLAPAARIIDPLKPTPIPKPSLAPLQGSLFAASPSHVAPADLASSLLRSVVRHQLDPCCWVDVAQNWFTGADDLLVTLLDALTWTCGRRLMYGTFHDEPRLSATAHITDSELPDQVRHLAAALDAHYLADIPARERCDRRESATRPADEPHRFDAVFCNYYRDGNDSVAWHADRVGRRQVDPLVVILCLGGPRPFRVRPMSGGPSTSFALGSGDLLVMGGAMQHHWQHAVPKVQHAPPRLSVTLRSGPGSERA